MSVKSLLGGLEELPANIPESFTMDEDTEKSPQKLQSEGASLIDQLLSDSNGVSSSNSEDGSNDDDDDDVDDESEDEGEGEEGNEDDDADSNEDDEGSEEEEGKNEESTMDIDEESNSLDKITAEFEREKIDETKISAQRSTVAPDIQQADDELSNIEATPQKGKKRKRKKAAPGEKKKKKKSKKSKPGNLRRNIRDIMKEDELDADTVAAQKEEAERRRRLLEVKKALEQKMKEREEKDSQLKSLLQDESKGDEVILLDSSDEGRSRVKSTRELSPVPSADTSTGDNDVIELSSDEEDDEEDDDDDSSTTKDEEIDLESEDPNNAGSHINDEINVPDDQGRVLVNIGHSADEEDIFLAPQIAKHIKRHQIGGVRFLYDNLIESLTRYKSSPGFGCILAHSMGLGKTIQMISFIEIFLRCANAKTVLLIVPINTLQNWMNEFNTWCPSKEMIGENNLHVITRSFDVFMLNENFKTTSTRAKVIDKWYQTGGVLLMGYEMYRLLSSRRGHIADKMKKPGRKPANPVVIDVEEEFKNKGLLVGVHEALINPGPDLIVCDEGHRIKNSQAGISQSLKNIKTKRRVVLTGYPLQNNLMEYWCMVDFVRPNYLGTKTEFSNMFERPINNGQCHDSTMSDEKLMRYRAHVLHSLLEGFVQRRGHTVLRDALPPKQEYIFLIRMSPIQRSLYKEFMESLMGAGLGTWANNNPLKAFAVCCKIWNHPDILYNLLNKRNAGTDDNDLDIETEGGPAKKPKAPKKPRVPQPVDAYYPPSDRNQEISYDWAKELMKDYMSGLLESGGKMVILFKLIEESLAQNDKLLVFSQSLFTLDLIEEFLSKYKVPRPDMDENWCKNRSYFRLDGSTASQEREKLINQFNAPDNNKSWLFLLSTRAGSLGVNLVGANRVVVVDASWNPCHDCQAICRVYRFGQVKPSYIYRLVTDNTMEKRIYDRQVTKQGMSNRVVDEMQVQNHFTRRQVDNLLQYEDQDFDEIDFNTAAEEFDDPVMVNVLRKEGKWLTRRPFEHESLLIDKKELRLTKKEKQLAKQSYVMEKRLNVSYTRPSYAAFYPKGTEPIRRQTVKIVNPPHMASWPSAYPGRPIASVKPMITTPVPMQIKKDGIRPGVQLVSKNKPGVTVHKVITTTDIMLPGTNTSTQAGAKPEPNRITAGQQIFIIKTPKGVYIRTATGKIFAVRAKFPLLQGLGAAEISTSSTSVSTVIVTASTTSSTFSTDSRSEMHTSGTTTVTTSSTTSTVMLSSIITDTIKRQDSSSSLTSALSAADLLKDSEPETRSQSLTGEETVELSKPAEPNTEMSSTEKLKPTVPETEVQISQIPSSEQRKTELSNAEEVELDTMPGKISKSDSTMTPPSTVSNSSRYQKIAPNLASFGAQLTSDINETISNQQMMSDNMSSVDTRLDEESNTPNLNSFTAQLAAASDPKMSSNYTNYGTSMGSNNDRMPGHPYHMQNMNQNSMMSPWYQNQMMYNSNPPSYTNTTQNPSPYNNASNMQSEQSSGTMQNMHQNSMGDMSNSSMQNMGMTGMPTMSPMSMQHSMMGFPFAPYPFPMPQPYLMGGIDPGYMPHMPMGQGTGGYMPQGMGMPHNMGMGVPQNTINMSSYHHGNGGSMSNTMNAFRENSNGSQQ